MQQVQRYFKWHKKMPRRTGALPISREGVAYFENGVGRGVLSLEGGRIGSAKLGWSPVSVFRNPSYKIIA